MPSSEIEEPLSNLALRAQSYLLGHEFPWEIRPTYNSVSSADTEKMSDQRVTETPLRTPSYLRRHEDQWEKIPVDDSILPANTEERSNHLATALPLSTRSYHRGNEQKWEKIPVDEFILPADKQEQPSQLLTALPPSTQPFLHRDNHWNTLPIDDPFSSADVDERSNQSLTALPPCAQVYYRGHDGKREIITTYDIFSPEGANEKPYQPMIEAKSSNPQIHEKPVPDGRISALSCASVAPLLEKNKSFIASEPVKTPTRSLHRLFNVWLFEMICCGLAVGSLAGIVIVVRLYQDRTLPEWSQKITINSVISIFVVILKCSLTFVATQGLSQLKWTWFRDRRPLEDIAHYDNASRSPWGAARLLWVVKHHQLASSVAAVVVIVALALDPLAQQIVRTFNCSLLLDDTTTAALSNQTCLEARWVWLIFPVALILIVVVFLAVMIVQADKIHTNYHHGFKSSPLALLFHGLDDEVRKGLGEKGCGNDVKSLTKDAREIHVRFEPTGRGWGFVGAGYGEEEGLVEGHVLDAGLADEETKEARRRKRLQKPQTLSTTSLSCM